MIDHTNNWVTSALAKIQTVALVCVCVFADHPAQRYPLLRSPAAVATAASLLGIFVCNHHQVLALLALLRLLSNMRPEVTADRSPGSCFALPRVMNCKSSDSAEIRPSRSCRARCQTERAGYSPRWSSRVGRLARSRKACGGSLWCDPGGFGSGLGR